MPANGVTSVCVWEGEREGKGREAFHSSDAHTHPNTISENTTEVNNAHLALPKTYGWAQFYCEVVE